MKGINKLLVKPPATWVFPMMYIFFQIGTYRADAQTQCVPLAMNYPTTQCLEIAVSTYYLQVALNFGPGDPAVSDCSPPANITYFDGMNPGGVELNLSEDQMDCEEIFYTNITAGCDPNTGTFNLEIGGETCQYLEGVLLPVVIGYFRVHPIADGLIRLEWETLIEMMSETFLVERSKDGRTFQPIGEVPAAGHSDSPRYYEFLDREPGSGDNYYRLKMMDLDGTFEYTDVQYVRADGPSGNMVLFPNPTKDRLSILLPEGLPGQESEFIVLDVSGKSVLQFRESVPERSVVPVDISSLQNGTYYLRAMSGPVSYNRTFTIVR